MRRILIIFTLVLSFFALFGINCFVLADGENCREVKYDCKSKWGDIDLDSCKTKTVCDESKDGEGGVSIGSVGIIFGGDCLTGMGKGCFNYEKMIGIEDQQRVKYSAESIVQDIVLAATSMVGVVLTIVLIYCGLMYIFAARGGKDPSTYKKGLIDAGIGAVLVWGAYTIIRLIQYIAKG